MSSKVITKAKGEKNQELRIMYRTSKSKRLA